MNLSSAEREVAAKVNAELQGHVAALVPGTTLYTFLAMTMYDFQDLVGLSPLPVA